jgi:hypothetical protein
LSPCQVHQSHTVLSRSQVQDTQVPILGEPLWTFKE